MSGLKEEACLECTKKCLKTHGKKPSSPLLPPPTPLSFFKIMIGEFSKATFIPPKFARTLGGLVNQGAYLEDSNGHHWRVKVTVLDGSLAFQQGWHEFVVDHSIELGEVVLFKYISTSLFSAQIFGTSACERVRFLEKNNSSNRKRKKNKTEPSSDSLHLHKDHKRSETPIGKCYTVDEDSVKKAKAIKTTICDKPSFEMIASKCVVQDMGEHLNSPEKSAHHANSSGRPASTIINYSEAPCYTIDEDSITEQEACKCAPDMCNNEEMNRGIMINGKNFLCDNNSRVPIVYQKEGKKPRVTCDGSISKYQYIEGQTSTADLPRAPQEEITILPIHLVEMVKAKCYAEDTDRLLISEEKLSHHSNSLSRSQIAVECNKPETKNPIVSGCAMATYTLLEKGRPTIGYSQGSSGLAERMRKKGANKIRTYLSDPGMINCKLNSEEIAKVSGVIGKTSHFSNSFVRPQSANSNCTKDEGENLIESKSVACKFPFPEEEICYISDDDLMDELGETRITPIDSHVTGNSDSVCQAGKVAKTKGNSSQHVNSHVLLCTSHILDCTKDEKGNLASSCEAISCDPHTEGNLSSLGNVPSSLSEKEDAPCVGSAHHSMTDLPEYHKDPHVMEGNSCQSEEDEKKVTPCLKEVLKVVKAESIDSIDLPPPNSVIFIFTLSVNVQSWLELPETLPSNLGKKKHERKVITLRDPVMRTWPVIYHESFKFVGFFSGWKAFAVANNLQQGDTLLFENARESNPTLKVRISKGLDTN